MNRTIKFQLSNVKTTFSYAAMLAYGFLAFFLVIALIFDPGVLGAVSNLPLWLTILMYAVTPFTFLVIIYVIFDGLMFFDTSLRFGISRKNYFVTQIFIYIILSGLLSFATGVTKTEWTGAASSYFSAIGQNYLSIDNLTDEFIRSLAIATMALAFYRFKAKAIIAGILLYGFFMFVAVAVSLGDSIFFERIGNIVVMIVENPEMFTVIYTVLLISVYYLFVTKIEVQD